MLPSLEEIFQNTIDNFQNKSKEMAVIHPVLKEIVVDPHVQRMISAFALISSNLEYKVNVEVNNQIESILLNLQDKYTPAYSTAIVKVITNKSTLVESNQQIICQNGSATNLFNTPILPVEVTQFAFKGGDLEIYISKKKQCKIGTICLFTSINLINSIFGFYNEADAYIKETDISCKLYYRPTDLAYYLNNENTGGFFNLTVETIQNLDDFTLIIKNIEPIQQCFFYSNCLLIANKHYTQSNPICNSKSGLLPIIASEKEVVEEVISVYADNHLIPHVSTNSNGWYTVKDNKETLYVYVPFDSSTSYCNIICSYKSLNTSEMFIEQIAEAQLSLVLGFSPKIVNTMHIENAISLLESKDDIEKYFIALISIVNKEKKRIQIISYSFNFTIRPIKINKLLTTTLCSLIIVNTNSTNAILWKLIIKEMKKNYNCEFDIRKENITICKTL